jgi:hypothetical protein
MLLTAGCSFVWGDELAGFNTIPPTHWENTFTEILAKKMGIDYVNLGRCGAGNEQIFRNITDHLHNNPDQHITHMVVLWSAWQRSEWVEYYPSNKKEKLGRELDVTQFSSLRTNNIHTKKIQESFDNWYGRCYDTRTDIMHTLTKMKIVELLCASQGIKLIQGTFHKRNWTNILAVLTDAEMDGANPIHPDMQIDKVPEYKEWLVTSLGKLKSTSRVGMGKSGAMKDLYTLGQQLGDIKEFGHPGEKTNLQYANLLFETFTKMENGTL